MLAAQHSGDAKTRIVQEMGIWSGSARIDVAVINGELTGYEIKSDRDTLDRLAGQEQLYSRVFDRVILVVGRKHADAARQKVPKWWGITIARVGGGDSISLTARRTPKPNPSIDPYLVAKLLWKSEALTILNTMNLAKGWRAKGVDALHQRLAEQLDLQVLSRFVRDALKARASWLGQPVSNEREMAARAYAHPSGPTSNSW
jgi:hypothetical protein